MDRSTYNQAMDILEALNKSVDSMTSQLEALAEQEKSEGCDNKEV